MPATIPVRMSPVPPVAMPGLPVVFTQASPSGCTTSVRWPFSTTISSCSRANFRATPSRSFCTSAMRASRQPRHLARMRSDHQRPALAIQFTGAAFKCIQAVGIEHHGKLEFRHQTPHQLRSLRIPRNSRPDREHGLPFRQLLNSIPARWSKWCPLPSPAKARSSTRDEIPPRLPARTSALPQSRAPLPRAARPSPPSRPIRLSRAILQPPAHARSSLCSIPPAAARSAAQHRAR